MSDSTIDDALKLLETGKGNPDRLKEIIKTFETKSLIYIQDRKYIEALVEQYLTPRHRVSIKKIESIRKQETGFPRIRKPAKPDFELKKVMDVSISSPPPSSPPPPPAPPSEPPKEESKPISEERKETGFERYEREFLERQSGIKQTPNETSIEEKFVEQIEAKKPQPSKKSNKKFFGIGIGILAIIIIAGGAAIMPGDTELFSSTEIVERITCDTKPLLVSSTKVPGFPDPEKDLQHYLDRYENEPKYKEWFDRNFPDQTMQEVLVVPTSGPNVTKIPGFPDPEKDLQHYLDRYENEPKYKEWFDKNFPDQTIRNVVC